ncbi:MAG: NAD-dependent epimerase/dehydratase family protein [Planctomycetota bacterium]
MQALPARHFRKVLITGAAGFIGSHLTERCLSLGAEVTGLDCLDDFYDPALKRANLEACRAQAGFRFVEGDLRDPGRVKALLGEKEPYDVVVHLAARAGVRPSLGNPALYVDVNVGGTLAVLEALRERPETRLVFASSSSVYGGRKEIPFRETDDTSWTVSPYAATKKAGEVLCHTYHHLYGIPIFALRFFTVYGPRQRPEMAIASFARRMRTGEPIPVFGDGESARDYTFVSDIVDGVVRAMERVRGFEIFNLGESRTVKLSELVEKLGRALGAVPRVETHPMQPGDVPLTCADVDKARRLLGYRPAIPIEKGLEAYARWLQNENTVPGQFVHD